MEKKIIQVKLTLDDHRLLKAAAAFNGELMPDYASSLIKRAIAKETVFTKKKS